jgi:hypothetical protein
MPGIPLNNPNWAPDLADVVERYVGKVRTTATDNAVKASRAIVFGVLVALAVLVAVPLGVILLIGIVRETIGTFTTHARAVYLSYFVVGFILFIAGFVALRLRHKETEA